MSNSTPKQKMLRGERDPEVRFWMQVKSSKDGCWEFAPDRVGPYRQIHVNGKNLMAHRYSYELHFGPIPEGKSCCHRCDNPKCVRPDHLFLGTQKDNIQDAIAKGRLKYRGEVNGASKLTEADIRNAFAMRAEGMSLKCIASHFHMDPSHISEILQGKHWQHLCLEAFPKGRPSNLRIKTGVYGKKLTATDVREMHKMRAAGMMVKDIAAHFGINKVGASETLAGKKWKHIYKELHPNSG